MVGREMERLETNGQTKNQLHTKCQEDENCESSSEEELDAPTILKTLYKHYGSTNDDEDIKLLAAKTSSFLENVLQSGTATCLVCIESIRHIDPIWSCRHCYCFFHLNCIARWANDSMAQLKNQQQQQVQQGYYNNLGEYVAPTPKRPLHWFCPQCREEYAAEQRPTQYLCFCGKEINPVQQSWLIPHSCGEICSKALVPNCGHKCLLLCHPGSCPPCAQYALTTCLCGQSKPKSLRCIDKQWQCERKCEELLSCSQHRCNKICHMAGKCPPCESTSLQPCACNAKIALRPCSDLKWHCKKVCGKSFSCGIHRCKRVCHAGDCGQCPLGLPRSCPCGRTKKTGKCTEIVQPCGDTCHKLLKCGKHTCVQRCHYGECNLCLTIITKICRCGQRQRELPCSKEFTCDTKCKELRDCFKHPCNRKCCDGRCLPCDKVCGKLLSCKKHKCKSICHNGPCYPCKRQSQLKCRCGTTTKTFPCGHERKVRIVCPQLCRIPPKCHHKVNHRCHKQECPPCEQICGLRNNTTGCEHLCAAKCHTAVRVKGEVRKLPHPKCEKLIQVYCIGGHEVTKRPCWNSKPTSCQRPCNRELKCGNHKCERICHNVANIFDKKEQMGCSSCELGCELPRPDGCVHRCRRGCHLPPCEPCPSSIKIRCHCGLTQVIYKCSEYYTNEIDGQELNERRERLKSCGDRCIKTYECGHRCVSICHSGPCPTPENCRKKVRVFCKCKRLKTDISCNKQRAGNIKTIPCDNRCEEIRAYMERLNQLEIDRERQLQEEHNRLELELFERKSVNCNRRRPREREPPPPPPAERYQFPWERLVISISCFLPILLALVLAGIKE